MRAVLKLKPMLLLFLALGLFGLASSNEDRRPVPDKMRPGFDSINPVDSASFLEFITADELEGRDTPSKGQTIARRYIQSLYKSWGVAPLGDAAGPGARSYEQSLPMIIKTYGPGTSMSVQSPNLTRTFVMGGDFSCGMGANERGSLKGGVVFAGYGISAPDLGYDDFAGIDVRDRIVLVAAGKPRGESGDTVFTNPRNWAWFAGRRTPVENLARLLARKGALALVVADDAWDEGDGPEGYRRDARIPSASNKVYSPSLTVADPMTPTFWASPRIADAVFGAAGRSFGDTKRLIDAGLRPASFAFSGLTMSIEVDVAHKAMSSANVLGIVEESDPELKKEYVVIGGHLDHVGMTADGYVFHGADDNGLGSVGVLQAARAFAINPVKPRRSVIFAHWTGEEKGLLGSLAFVKFQPVPLDKVVACINLDMISHDTSPKEVRTAAEELRRGSEVTDRITNDPARLLMAYVSLPSPSFTDTITGLSAGFVDLDVVPLPLFPMLGNSDHYFFALARVPSVFFFTGGQADTHQPGDTADKINAKKMAEVVKLAFLTAYSVADAPDRPRWE